MIIHDNKMILKSLDAIASAKDCSFYRILPTGELLINNFFKSHVFLAYVRRNWFASYGMRKGSSVEIPEKGMDLFSYGNDSIWVQNEKKEVDISTSVIPLDENTRVALFAFSGKYYDVIIADGSRYSTVISTHLKQTPENCKFLAFALASLIRHYDEKSADEIEQFWFRRKQTADSETCESNDRNKIAFEEDEAEMTEQKEKVVLQW